MSHLRTALATAGAGRTDVVETTNYVANHARDDLAMARNVVLRHLGAHDVPSTLLEVAVLGTGTNSTTR